MFKKKQLPNGLNVTQPGLKLTSIPVAQFYACQFFLRTTASFFLPELADDDDDGKSGRGRRCSWEM